MRTGTDVVLLQGIPAIDWATAHDCKLCKYTDPIYPALDDLTIEEALDITLEDPSLIYLMLRHTGWTLGDGSNSDGYKVEDYFADGSYLGPDAHGIEPVLEVMQ